MAPATIWEPDKKAISRRKRLRIIRISLIAAALVAYATGIWYFSSHFLPGTTVDGVDASLMDTAQLSDAIEQRASSYELQLIGPNDFTTTISSADISMASEATQVADEALARTTPALWLPTLLAPQHMLIDANVTYDQERLAQLVSEAVDAYNAEAEPPTNASASYDEESQTFVISPDALGTALDAEPLVQAATSACTELLASTSVGDEALRRPEVTHDSEQLVASVDQANGILDRGVNVACDGNVIATADRNTIASWMTILDDQSLDISHVQDWVESNEDIVAAGNATDEEHVWELDSWATAVDVHRVMEQDLGDDAQVIRYAVVTKPAATPGAKERGRHVDVNLTTQFCRFYDSDGTVIWDSYCVTGGWDYEKGVMHETPTGTFHLENKQTGVTLIGADLDNDQKPDYESYVNYWMPFYMNDVGFHDATWRSEFGGDIRSWWGSHGCINLPYDKAVELWDLIVVGDEVVVHY